MMANSGRSRISARFVRLIYGLHGRPGRPPSLQEIRAKDRLAPFFGSCAPAARWQRVFGGAARPRRVGAKPRHHTNWTSVDPGGIGFRGGRMRRRRVRSNLPSGLLTAQGSSATQASFCRLPRRLGGQIGGCHRLLPSTPGGWSSATGRLGRCARWSGRGCRAARCCSGTRRTAPMPG